MTFPIDGSIPASGNNPSQDQPRMQTNFANLISYLSVDHVSPGTTPTAGYHDQVSFAINQSAPGIGSGVAELFVNSLSGLFGTQSTLRFQNASQTVGLTNLALTTTTPGATGYGISTPWGLILNFGSVNVGNAPGINAKPITWQIPFTNAYFCSASNGSSNTAGGASFNSFTNAGVTLYANQNTTVYFLAIGS